MIDPRTWMGVPLAYNVLLRDHLVKSFTPRGNETSSGGNDENALRKSAIKRWVLFSSPSIIILNISLNLVRTTSGVEDLIASMPMILSFGSAYCTPSELCTFRIYLFFAVHIPRFAITSRAITIRFV